MEFETAFADFIRHAYETATNDAFPHPESLKATFPTDDARVTVHAHHVHLHDHCRVFVRVQNPAVFDLDDQPDFEQFTDDHPVKKVLSQSLAGANQFYEAIGHDSHVDFADVMPCHYLSHSEFDFQVFW